MEPERVELYASDDAVLATVERLLGVATFVWTPGVIARWSSGLFAMLELSPDAVTSSAEFFDRVHPDDRARLVMNWEVARRVPISDLVFRIVVPARGERRICGYTHIRTGADGAPEIVCAMLDVTGAEVGKEQLADALALLADTQHAAGVGSYVYEIDTGVHEWSDGLYRVLGVARDDAVDAGLAARLVHPDDAARQLDWGIRVGRGETLPPLRVRIVRPDGKTIHLESRARRVERPRGPCVVGISMDVTERVELEHQLHHAAKMDAVGTLAAGIAHDFNNYLMVLSAQLELVKRGTTPPTGEQLRSMGDAVSRCTGLVRQLLSFARQHPFRPQPIDLAAQVRGVVSLFERVSRPDIAVEIRAAAPTTVTADRGQLDGAVMNLLVNARDALPDGGTITIEVTAEHLDAGDPRLPRDATPGAFAHLRVHDTGAGIAADALPRIFEPYFTTKDLGRGTGLGLAVVYGTVHQHGGAITVDSGAGRGTAFDVWLPITGGSDAPAATTSAALSPLRILLVEDVAAVRTAIATLLDHEGHTVTAAEHGAAALAIVEGGATFDVVLSDVVMPVMNGRKLAQRLAELTPDLPVILMSGNAAHSADPSLAVHLDKPFTREQLDDALRAALARRGAG